MRGGRINGVNTKVKMANEIIGSKGNVKTFNEAMASCKLLKGNLDMRKS